MATKNSNGADCGLLKAFELELCRKSCSPFTVRCYLGDVSSLLGWCARTFHKGRDFSKESFAIEAKVSGGWIESAPVTNTLLHLSLEQLQAFLSHNPNWSPNTRARMTAAIRSLYWWLERTGWVAESPSRNLKVVHKVASLEGSLASLHDLDKLRAEPPQGADRSTLRSYAMFLVSLESGATTSELVSLNCGDLSEDGTLQLGHQRRSRNDERTTPTVRHRTVKLTGATLEAIRRCQQMSGDWQASSEEDPSMQPLFSNKWGERLSERSVRRSWEKWMLRCGLKESIPPRHLRNLMIVRWFIEGKSTDEVALLAGLVSGSTLGRHRTFAQRQRRSGGPYVKAGLQTGLASLTENGPTNQPQRPPLVSGSVLRTGVGQSTSLVAPSSPNTFGKPTLPPPAVQTTPVRLKATVIPRSSS